MDAEAEVISYLSGSLGVAVLGDVPNPRPQTLVTVERTGGPTGPYVDEASLAVQCWAPTRADASALATAAVRALSSIEDGGWALSCECESTAWFPGERGEPRYQVVIHVCSYS